MNLSDRAEHKPNQLSGGQLQRIAIARALLKDAPLVILDEPTSVLTPQAVEKLFVTLRRLSEQGTSILYISHKLDEIRALCHHCTVLRGGKVTGEVDPTQESNASLSRLMIGAEPPQLQHKASAAVESRERFKAGSPGGLWAMLRTLYEMENFSNR